MMCFPRQLRYVVPLLLFAAWLWSYVLSINVRLDWPGGCLWLASREAHLDFTWRFGQVHKQWLDVEIERVGTHSYYDRTIKGWIKYHFGGFRLGRDERIRCLPGFRAPGPTPTPPPTPPQPMNYEAVIPYWLFLILAITPVTIAHIRQRSETPMQRRGLCSNCDYDLRATPSRCPECGHQPTTVAHQ